MRITAAQGRYRTRTIRYSRIIIKPDLNGIELSVEFIKALDQLMVIICAGIIVA